MKKLYRTILTLSLTGIIAGTAQTAVFADNDADRVAVLESEQAVFQEKVGTLESEKQELQEKVKTLESENEVLKTQLESLQSTQAEPETEVSTDVVGTVYTEASIVKAVQQALNAAGFECGTPDGQAGSRTSAAISAYETEKKLNVNGVITDELIASLGIQDEIAEAAEKEAMMKEYSGDYSYTQIARAPDSFIGEKMKFRGKVLQEGDAGSGLRYIRLAVNSDYDAVLFVSYNSDIVDMKILDDDIITVYGSCIGDYTYETVMGASITLPWLDAAIIDMSEVATS